MTSLRILAGLVVILASAGIACAEVIISEIMFNPASKEDPKGNIVEWVEIYNAGDKAVDISGWFLQDEDGKTVPLPRNTTIKAGQAVVLVPAGMTEEKFRAAWGEGFDIYPLGGWTKGGMNGLANNPSETNEKLSLRMPDGKVADDAHYRIDGDWPKPPKPAGGSLILKPDSLNSKANDNGKNWVYAEAGKLGAKNNTKTEEFNGKDVGSPGVVAKE
jgi:hypothetical protein